MTTLPDGAYCKRCVMWVFPTQHHHDARDCTYYRSLDMERERLVDWIGPVHPTWFCV